jgi:thiol-disulfide isomerase/thioredoxin
LNRNVIFILCVVLGITALLLVGKRSAHRPDQANTSAANPGSGGSGELSAGSMAPDFTLKSIPDGRTIQLSSLRGKAVMLNFWATWCEPCKIEIPWLVDLQKKYGPQGLQVVGMAKDESSEKTIADFAHKMGMNYPIVVTTSAINSSYGDPQGLPTTFFVDRSGKLVDQVIGLKSMSDLEDAIQKSLGQKQ